MVAAGLPVTSALAGEVQVTAVKVTSAGGEAYRFDVTLAHADEGWDHYANQWDVLTLDGEVLGVRELLHPHVEEQPFTRSQVVKIPADVTQVRVRGRDSVHGHGSQEVVVDIPR